MNNARKSEIMKQQVGRDKDEQAAQI